MFTICYAKCFLYLCMRNIYYDAWLKILLRYRYQFMRTMSNENSFLVNQWSFVFGSYAVSLLKRSERNYLYLFYCCNYINQKDTMNLNAIVKIVGDCEISRCKKEIVITYLCVAYATLPSYLWFVKFTSQLTAFTTNKIL